MERDIGIGVIGLGWMGRVHTSSYRRVLEHFPDLGVTPRLVVAADLSPERRAHAERVGFERTVEDWRAVVDDPAVDAGQRHAAERAAPRGRDRRDRGRQARVGGEAGRPRRSTDTAAVADAARARRHRSTPSASATASRPPSSTRAALIEAGEIGEVNHYRGVVPRRLRQPARRRRLVALLPRGRRLGRARRPDGAHRRHDALPRRPDRAPERADGDDDPAPAAPADRRGHALQPRRDRRARRRRERGLGGAR